MEEENKEKINMIDDKDLTDKVLDQVALPPPFTRVVEYEGEGIDPSSEDAAFSAMGRIKLDAHGKLYREYVAYAGFTDFLTVGVDNWVNNILPRQISSRSLFMDDGTNLNKRSEVVFGNVSIVKPSTINGETLYPNTVRIRGDSYMSKILVDMILLNDDGTPKEKVEKMLIGSMPTMLGSDLCNLKGLSPIEQHKKGEHLFDVKGYFIIKGQERLILLQEHLKLNKMILYPNKKGNNHLCKINIDTPKGSRVIELSDVKRVLMLKTQMIPDVKYKLPALAVFHIFGIYGDKNITDYILQFVKDEHRTKVWHVLQPSLLHLNAAVGDVYEYIIKTCRKETAAISATLIETTKKQFLSELFPAMNDQPVINKLDMYSIMIVRFCKFLAGLQPADDRDSWEFKRLDTAAKLMQDLFTAIWSSVIDQTQKIIDTKKVVGLQSLRNKFYKNIITDEFINSFSSNWGVKSSRGTTTQKDCTNILVRVNQIASYSHMRRINVDTDRQIKQSYVRMAHGSQKEFVDAGNTPEGAACGLVKNLSAPAMISLDRSELTIQTFFEGKYSAKKSEKEDCKLLLNSRYLGWCNGLELHKYALSKRRDQTFAFDVGIILDAIDNFLSIFTDASRPVTPLLIVDEDGILVLDKKQLWTAPFSEILREAAAEYVDPAEMTTLHTAYSKENLRFKVEQRKKAIEKSLISLKRAEEQGDKKDVEYASDLLARAYKMVIPTHINIDPSSQLSVAVAVVPMPHKQKGPRNSYQSNMGLQGLGVVSTNADSRMETTTKSLMAPQRSLFEAQMSEMIGLNDMPAGRMCTVAIMPFKGYGQEDAFIGKEESKQRGLFTYIKHITIKDETSNDTSDYDEYFARPPPNPKRKPEKYRLITERGIPQINKEAFPGDVIIGKVRRYGAENRYEDISVVLGSDERGIVERVVVSKNANNNVVIKVKLRQVRQPQPGDKIAARYAQKGTFSKFMPESKMPFNSRGQSPDVILHPVNIIKRETMGMYFEFVASKFGALKGEFINATAHRDFDPNEFGKFMMDMGYDPWGKEKYYSGETGEEMEAEVFVGPCYYNMLKHHVSDKYQHRQRGAVKPMTREPLGGRGKGMAMKVGHMERVAIASHGAAEVLQERFCIASDAYEAIVCRNCGVLSVADHVVKKQIVCRNCRSDSSSGKVTIPYVYKYLISLLAGANMNVTLGFKKPDEDVLKKDYDEEADEEEVELDENGDPIEPTYDGETMDPDDLPNDDDDFDDMGDGAADNDY